MASRRTVHLAEIRREKLEEEKQESLRAGEREGKLNSCNETDVREIRLLSYEISFKDRWGTFLFFFKEF